MLFLTFRNALNLSDFRSAGPSGMEAMLGLSDAPSRRKAMSRTMEMPS